MGRQTRSSSQHHQRVSRPKRRANKSHFFRYLQTRNPSKLEENDLKRALEASLEERPDYWPEDTASCSSSEPSNATGLSSSSSSSSTSCLSSTSTAQGSLLRRSTLCAKQRLKNCSRQPKQSSFIGTGASAVAVGSSHQNNNSGNHCSCQANSSTAHQSCCQMSSTRNRYKPVAKNIYSEADFFHDGIMDYIEYQLSVAEVLDQKSRTCFSFANVNKTR